MPSVTERARALWRMSAVRQALISASLFFAVTALVTVLAFASLQSALIDRVDASLMARADAILATSFDDRQAIEDLEAAVSGLARSAAAAPDDDVDLLVALFLLDGRQLAGSRLQTMPAKAGMQTIHDLPQGDDDDAYRVFARDVNGVRLVVAESLEETEEIVALVAGTLFWGGLAVAIAVVVGGVLVGYGSQRRIAAIEQALNRVAAGALETRLPVGTRMDDIDRIASSSNAALSRLERSVVALRDLSANIAHDLKTPIARLRTTLERTAETVPPKASESLAAAVGEADSIAQTFDAVLRVTQIEAGQRRDRFTKVDLREVATTAVELYDDQSHGSIEINLPEAPVDVLGDRELLIQLAANLIGNAVKHGGTSPTRVDVESSPSLSVADHGPGIPEAERDRVLERFYRLDRSRSTGGTGLGLTLVKAIADLHHARLSLEDNRPGLRVNVALRPYGDRESP